jgi:ADP-ribose pyrophosphatase
MPYGKRLPPTTQTMKTVYEGKFLRLIHDRHWEYVSRVHARGAVAMVAVTPEQELVLVEQTRIPLQCKSIELPAGIVGDSAAFADESFEASALRELLEETGFEGAKAQILVRGPTAPGMTSEYSTLVAIGGLVRQHAGGGVDGEDISVHRVPIATAHEWLQAKAAEGLAIEPKIYAGLYFVASGLYAKALQD